MTIYEFISKHPDNHIRIICYVPGEDVLDDNGNYVCVEEGTMTTVFDSTTGFGDLAPEFMLKEIINSPEDEATDEDKMNPDYVYELEYIPDEYYITF